MICLEVFTESVVYNWTPRKRNFSVVTLHKKQPIFFKIVKFIRILNKEDPRIIFVTGWSRTADIIAISWAAYKCKPLVIMSDLNEMDFRRSSTTEWIKRRLITCASGGLCAGKHSSNYLCKLGVDNSKIFGFYNVVDNDHFSQDSNVFRVHNKFLIVSRLVEKKNIKFFLSAYLDYVRESLACGLQPWQLCIVGNGPLLEEFVEYVEVASLTRCSFSGKIL